MRDVAEAPHDHTEQIGMIKPGLQHGRAKLAQNPGEPENAARVGHTAAQIERAQRHTRRLQDRTEAAAVGHADHHRPKAPPIEMAGEVHQHALGAPRFQPGNQVQNRDHRGPRQTASRLLAADACRGSSSSDVIASIGSAISRRIVVTVQGWFARPGAAAHISRQ